MRSLIDASARVLATVALALAPAALAAEPADAAPNVLVTIGPVHSLVAGVMDGLGAPKLLIAGGRSPHDFQLRPSDAKALGAADLIVQVGAGLERGLEKPIATLATKALVLTAADVDGMTLLPYREGFSVGEEHEPGDDDHHADGDHEADHDAHDHAESGIDPHLWLNPQNARVVVAAVTAALSKLDPQNRDGYLANAARLDASLVALDAELRERLAPVSGVPYVVFHDGYHYLEARYGLSPVAAVTVNPELQPGARHLQETEATVAARGVRCIFVEPQFTPQQAETLAAAASLRIGVLDPVGADLQPGLDLYATLMRQNAAALTGCLGAR